MHKLSETESTTTFQFNLTNTMAKAVKERAKELHQSAGGYVRELISEDIRHKSTITYWKEIRKPERLC